MAGAPSPDSAATGRSAAALLRRVEVKVGRRLDGLGAIRIVDHVDHCVVRNIALDVLNIDLGDASLDFHLEVRTWPIATDWRSVTAIVAVTTVTIAHLIVLNNTVRTRR